MLTGDSTAESKRGALSLGARDFVPKPFDATEVLLRIRNMLESSFLQRELESQNAILETRVEERAQELAESQLEIVERLARAGEIRDDATGRHTYRVGQLSAFIAEALGTGSRYVELIRRAAPLHDVGKIGIREEILNKPGRLTPEEFEHVKQHVQIGLAILAPLSHLQTPLTYVEHHHERWDGTGYPRALAGDHIPLGARILCAADTFDALTSKRAYRDPMAPVAALEHLKVDVGKQFDPGVYDALVRVVSRNLRTVAATAG
jgi:putative two-component system response regulator